MIVDIMFVYLYWVLFIVLLSCNSFKNKLIFSRSLCKHCGLQVAWRLSAFLRGEVFCPYWLKSKLINNNYPKRCNKSWKKEKERVVPLCSWKPSPTHEFTKWSFTDIQKKKIIMMNLEKSFLKSFCLPYNYIIFISYSRFV